ncbi:MAG: tctC [Ramlibacter sp.]|nr:tctC [Ramlibacter sp.]
MAPQASHRRSLLLALGLAGSLLAAPAFGQAYPSRPVKIIVPFATGGPADNYARFYHMAGELFKSMADVYLVHIPYKGSSGARTDVIGGQVDMMFDAVTTMVEQIKAGKVKAIATTGRQRSDVLPDVPTVHESGVPNYEATIWLGLMAPKGTPKAVVDRLNEAVSKIGGNAEVRQQWGRQGATPLVMTPEVFDRYVQDDIAKWAKVIRTAHIKAE